MAKAVGIIGSLTGKIGNAVYRVRRGEQIASVYQPNVNNPKSKRQQFSRAKMALAVETMKPLVNALRLGWSLNFPTYEMQRAIGVAIPVDNEVISGGNIDSLRVDDAALALCISDGIMPTPMVSDESFSVESEVRFTVALIPQYFDGEGVDHENVGIVTVVRNLDNGEVVVDQQAVSGSSVNVSVDVPARWSGMHVAVYVFVKQLPEAHNGIELTVLPWRFPSRTSGTAFVATGTIA